MRKELRAFSLVELLIVIILVAVVAAIATPKILRAKQQAHETHLKAKLRVIRTALDRCRADTGLLPQNLVQLTRETAPTQMFRDAGVLVATPAGTWQGPYIDAKTAGIASSGTTLLDPVCGGTFAYFTAAAVGFGTVKPCATGTALDGSEMSQW